MKNNILVLTDFSENSWSALTYAARISQRYGFRLTVCNVYPTTRIKSIGNFLAERPFYFHRQEAQGNMEQFVRRLESMFANLDYATIVVPGKIVLETLSFLEKNESLFVVMGAKGKSNLRAMVLGSSTLAIIRNSPVGVLAVPNVDSLPNFENIGLLCNFRTMEKQILSSFCRKIRKTPNVFLFHVTENYHSPQMEVVESWKRELIDETGVLQIEYIEENAVYRLDYNMPYQRCIEFMVQKSSVGILLVCYNQKSFSKKLFEKNLVRKITHNLPVPTYFERFLT